MGNNLILDLSINFSLDIIKYCELLEEKRKNVIARQLLKLENYPSTGELPDKLLSIQKVLSKIIASTHKRL